MPEGFTKTASLPRVSILVPARNEADTIIPCIQSLAQQEYPNYELIVLDDQSTDSTYDRLQNLASQFDHVTVLRGTTSPPRDWNGKSYACHRLAQQATGAWLLFTDADTVHTPQSLSRGIRQALALKVDLLSALPHQQTGSWSERLMVSFIVDFLPMIGLDFQQLWQNQTTATVANGQYFLVKRESYNAIGGHAAIGEALVDDFALANHLRQAGYKIVLVSGIKMVSCRMYQNVREVWYGFTKNIVLSLETGSTQKRTWWSTLFFGWGYASLFVTPYILLFHSSAILSLIEIGWLAILRSLANQQFQRPWSEVLTTPLAALSVMVLGINALYHRWRQKGIEWKGRLYLGHS